MALARGTVTILWASKAPIRKYFVESTTSNLELLTLVVWGIKVINARSSSSAGMLMTKHGLVLAAKPKSTNQTSPRFGPLIRLLPLFQCKEDRIGIEDQFFIREGWPIVTDSSLDYLRGDLFLLLIRQAIKLFEDLLSNCSHFQYPLTSVISALIAIFFNGGNVKGAKDCRIICVLCASMQFLRGLFPDIFEKK